MRPSTLRSFVCALVTALALIGSVGACTTKVNTRFGPINGLWNRSTRGRLVAQYLGVPYALPPMGELRFRSPQRWNRTWATTFEAIENGPKCPQWDNDKIVGSEDCLYLNIYVPLISENPCFSDTLLPVMVFVHGGLFSKGSGDSRELPPNYLMDQNVILITVNYRLNILGFLSTGTEASPGNYGLKDVLEALRWVQDNVRSFHGDPDNVTLWGHSSGATLGHLLAMSNRTEGLFNRYIAHGSTALAPAAINANRRARSLAIRAARRLNCFPLKPEPADARTNDGEQGEADGARQSDKQSEADGNKVDGVENEINETRANDQNQDTNLNAGDKGIEEGTTTEQYEVDYEDEYTDEDEEDIMWCLRHTDVRDLLLVTKELRLKGDACCAFAPVIERESDDAVVTMHPLKAVEERRFRDLPFIMGITEHDGLSRTAGILAGNDTLLNWLLSDFENNLPYMLNCFQLSFNGTTFAKAIEDFYFSGNVSYTNAKENILMAQTDAEFMWPVYRTVKELSKFINSSIYFYLFSYEGTFTSTFSTGSSFHYGVAHADDLNYLIPILNKKFENYMLYNTENDVTMINVMTEMWASFAAKGVPEAWRIPAWPDWHESNEFLRFGNGRQPDVTVEKDLFPERMSFWEQLSKSMDYESTEAQFLMEETTQNPSNGSDIRTGDQLLLCILATLMIARYL